MQPDYDFRSIAVTRGGIAMSHANRRSKVLWKGREGGGICLIEIIGMIAPFSFVILKNFESTYTLEAVLGFRY